MSANLVARETGWNMREWGDGDRTTNEAFAPLATFGQRFDALLAHVRSLEFDAVDVWGAHLNPEWATEEHLRIARASLDRHGVRAVSLAGWFGRSTDELERTCRVAVALAAPVLGGSFGGAADARDVVGVLRRHGLRLALENHPDERTPAEMRAKIGTGGDGAVGTTIDTGWWATHGVDPVTAIEELAPHVLHVHLKDVRAAGAHDTCPWGEGVVPIERCVEALRRIGYEGAISVEHEPPDEDPSEACRVMRERLVRLLE